jgi:hypothetical protein
MLVLDTSWKRFLIIKVTCGTVQHTCSGMMPDIQANVDWHGPQTVKVAALALFLLLVPSTQLE